jgi:hypothetical protein
VYCGRPPKLALQDGDQSLPREAQVLAGTEGGNGGAAEYDQGLIRWQTEYQYPQHLKQDRAYPDPFATAKTNSHFKNSAKHVEIHPTPDSNPRGCDGKLGGRNRP